MSILTVSGTSCHQQLWRLHLTLALLRGMRPATVVKKEGGKVSIRWIQASHVGPGINLILWFNDLK